MNNIRKKIDKNEDLEMDRESGKERSITKDWEENQVANLEKEMCTIWYKHYRALHILWRFMFDESLAST